MVTKSAKNMFTGFTRLLKLEDDESASTKVIPSSSENILNKTDYDIYNAILTNIFTRTSRLILQQETKTNITLAYKPFAYQKLISSVPDLNSDFIIQFKKINKISCSIYPEFESNPMIEILPASKFEKILASESDLDKYQRKSASPAVLIKFSKPYILQNSIAVVEISHLFPPKIYCEMLIVLKKSKTNWNLVYSKRL